jgi:hypothetical protein
MMMIDSMMRMATHLFTIVESIICLEELEERNRLSPRNLASELHLTNTAEPCSFA